jgi:ribosomal protein S18 acetylase RimI-like enzyme
MSKQVRHIDAAGTAISVREQAAEDDAFLYSLFRANNMRTLELSGLPLAFLDDLVAMQHRSRMQTYQKMFPAAAWSIVECAGQPVGEIVEHDEGDRIYVVDIALLPDWQARGLGTALMREVMARCAARGIGVRAKVMINNEPSLKMFRKLGFVASAPDEVSYIELRFPAPVKA